MVENNRVFQLASFKITAAVPFILCCIFYVNAQNKEKYIKFKAQKKKCVILLPNGLTFSHRFYR